MNNMESNKLRPTKYNPKAEHKRHSCGCVMQAENFVKIKASNYHKSEIPFKGWFLVIKCDLHKGKGSDK